MHPRTTYRIISFHICNMIAWIGCDREDLACSVIHCYCPRGEDGSIFPGGCSKGVLVDRKDGFYGMIRGNVAYCVGGPRTSRYALHSYINDIIAWIRGNEE